MIINVLFVHTSAEDAELEDFKVDNFQNESDYESFSKMLDSNKECNANCDLEQVCMLEINNNH